MRAAIDSATLTRTTRCSLRAATGGGALLGWAEVGGGGWLAVAVAGRRRWVVLVWHSLVIYRPLLAHGQREHFPGVLVSEGPDGSSAYA